MKKQKWRLGIAQFVLLLCLGTVQPQGVKLLSPINGEIIYPSELGGGGAMHYWTADPNASFYKFRVYAMPEGKLIIDKITTDTWMGFAPFQHGFNLSQGISGLYFAWSVDAHQGENIITSSAGSNYWLVWRTANEEDLFESKIRAYPNPFSDILHIEGNVAVNSAKLYNIIGQEITDIVRNSAVERLTLKIPANLAIGQYLLTIEIEGKRQTLILYHQP